MIYPDKPETRHQVSVQLMFDNILSENVSIFNPVIFDFSSSRDDARARAMA